jgi:holliday junction resolvase YEN1
MLQQALVNIRKDVEVPWTFPDFKALGHYCNPAVSTTEQLRNLRGLKHGWDRPMDQPQLRMFLRERFNFTTREWMKHIMPVHLARALARASPEQRLENLDFGIKLKKTRKKKGDDFAALHAEVKITFSPLPRNEVDLSVQPPEEDWSKFTSKDGTPYDPLADLDCEVLECFLEHGLPEGSLEQLKQAANSPNKRKRKDDASLDEETGAKKRRKKTQAPQENATFQEANAAFETGAVKPKCSRKRKQTDGANKEAQHKKPASKISQTEEPLYRPTFQMPRSIPEVNALKLNVVDLCDDNSESEIELFCKATSSTASSNLDSKPQPTAPSPTLEFAPGEVIAPATLRQMRATSTLLRQYEASSSRPSDMESKIPMKVQDPVIIDLT